MTRPILYDFFATWCGPCKIQSPIIDTLMVNVGDKVDVKKVDVDQFSDLANKYKISVVPTLIIEKDGKVIHRLEGVTDAAHLEALLRPLI
ncbi:MAG TPA: thioredoxin domain-containing protein [Methanocorpusculum sp.]|nr:thioredoxin domain-containing protein [Methanocorpusculum sp.]HJK01354.1 thioredoxin domain-containing protein [Methanocorpusculum sp.]HJK01808.1 thioredoxin domain-containing protein [Methanocorpusculum sp.]